jgi:hypothetical protein
MNPSESNLRAGWKKPLPDRLARPTYWPATLGFGITLALLGPVTLMVMTGVGLALSLVAIIGWIGEIVHDGNT